MNAITARLRSRRAKARVVAKPMDRDLACRWILAVGFAAVLTAIRAQFGG